MCPIHVSNYYYNLNLKNNLCNWMSQVAKGESPSRGGKRGGIVKGWDWEKRCGAVTGM